MGMDFFFFLKSQGIFQSSFQSNYNKITSFLYENIQKNMLVLKRYHEIKHSHTTVGSFWSKFRLSKTSFPISKQRHLNLVWLPHGLPYGINLLSHFLALKTRESSLQAAWRPRSFVCQPCVSLDRGHGWRHKQSGPDWAEIKPLVGACRAGRSSHTAVADCRCFCWRCRGLKCCCQVSLSQIEFIIIGWLGVAGGGKLRMKTGVVDSGGTQTCALIPEVSKKYRNAT